MRRRRAGCGRAGGCRLDLCARYRSEPAQRHALAILRRERHRLAELLAAFCDRLHHDGAGVDGDFDAVEIARDEQPVALDGELDVRQRRRDVDAQVRELRLERRGAVGRGLRAVELLERARHRRGFAERGPRARRASEPRVALAEVHQRADRRIDALAALELGARLGVFSGLEQREPGVEQRLRCGLVRARIRAREVRRKPERERKRAGRESRPNAACALHGRDLSHSCTPHHPERFGSDVSRSHVHAGFARVSFSVGRRSRAARRKGRVRAPRLRRVRSASRRADARF